MWNPFSKKREVKSSQSLLLTFVNELALRESSREGRGRKEFLKLVERGGKEA